MTGRQVEDVIDVTEDVVVLEVDVMMVEVVVNSLVVGDGGGGGMKFVLAGT